MLDDNSQILALDKGNALGIIAGQPEQLKHEYEMTAVEHGDIANIVVAGMGGSALAAEFIKSWLSDRLPVPLVIVRDYSLPAFVNERTLLVASSYSGNTEETVSALGEAKSKGAKIVVSCSGGKLAEMAAEGDYPLITLPTGFQPRLAVLYGVRSLAQLLEQVGLASGLVEELEAAADWMNDKLGVWTADSPTADNAAKQIAEQLVGHGVVVYGGSTLALPTMKWKIDINENSKNLAFYNYFPEFNHNEFNGWLHPEDKPLKVVELLSNLDNPQITKRFEVTNRLLSGNLPKPIQVQAVGETKLQQMMWTLILGDFVSAYLAFLNGIDPTPVELIEKFKKELA